MAAQITAAIGEKGGDAKSTTIQNLAVQLARRGNRVLVADTDPQRTTHKWGQRRHLEKMRPAIDVREVTARGLLELLDKHSGEFEHILIDTAGADSDGMRVALMVSDTVLCPCVPSQADVETLVHVNALVGRAKAENPKLEAYVFATMVPSHALGDVDELRTVCASLRHLVLMHTVIGFRKAFKNALRDGLGVVEYPVDSFTAKAIDESVALETEIWGLP